MSCPNCGSEDHIDCSLADALVKEFGTPKGETTSADVAAVKSTRFEVWQSRLKDSVEELEAAKRQLEALEQEWPAKHRDGYADTRALVRATNREIEMLIPALRLAHKHATGGKQ